MAAESWPLRSVKNWPRGHEVHFISSERPFRFPEQSARVHFHPVSVNKYELFRYPDYTLPLSVKMAEVSRDYGLDVLHAHYAVPHATSAILARSMLPHHLQPRVVTTLHGTDTTLLGRDAELRPGHPIRARLLGRGHGRFRVSQTGNAPSYWT